MKLLRYLLMGVMLMSSLGGWPGGDKPLIEAAEVSADEIIARVDANSDFSSSYSRSTMIIRQGNREMAKEMLTWADGDGNGLVEFVNAADRGTKYLKLGDELWMFFPDAD